MEDRKTTPSSPEAAGKVLPIRQTSKFLLKESSLRLSRNEKGIKCRVKLTFSFENRYFSALNDWLKVTC